MAYDAFFFFFLLITSSLFTLSTSSSPSYYLHQRHLLQIQSSFPQNIETFFPFGTSTPETNQPSKINPPQSIQPNSPLPSSSDRPVSPPTSRTPPLLPATKSGGSSSSITKAVVATAASTLVVAGVFFFFFQRYTLARRRRLSEESLRAEMNPYRRDETSRVSYDAFKTLHGNLKGLIVDENGLDVLYWRKLESSRRGDGMRGFKKEVLGGSPDEEKRESVKEVMSLKNCDHALKIQSGKQAPPVSEAPKVPRTCSSSPPSFKYLNTASSKIQSESTPTSIATANDMGMARPTSIPPAPPFPKSDPPPPPPPPQPPQAPTPPAIAVNKTPAPPPPPPTAIKKNPMPPPPPPRAGGLKPPFAPPSASKGKMSNNSMSEPSSTDSSKEIAAGPTKLKPLHWDKVVANPDHSMVWDKIGSGSFRVDDDLMEALFGYVATNRKSVDANKTIEYTSKSNANTPTQICLLDPRKSQNIAIVLRSLSLSRQEILGALLTGSGLNADTLEKLTKIAPAKEEETMILNFSGNPSKLADAESFLYHLLRTVPSPFLRLDAMLFKLTYDSEILLLKESLQTLESACTELRRRGLFLKLLEAVLKAGNRMNAGTARGNAQAFNLTALCKLSDVKSTDGKTTLLHFVVEEVVRSEGKRCLINRNHSLGRTISNSSPNIGGKEEREKEYIMLGLPVVGGLSVELSNVNKAATIDYNGFISACAALTARVNGIRQFLGGQILGGGDVFVREMKGFLEAAEEELKVVKEEEVRVMDLVKRTTEYYQAGASKNNGAQLLHLFIIVKDFLTLVDKVCIDIARSKQQKKKPVAGVGGSSPPPAPAKRIPVRFPNLPAHFMSDHSKTSSSSDSDDDF